MVIREYIVVAVVVVVLREQHEERDGRGGLRDP